MKNLFKIENLLSYEFYYHQIPVSGVKKEGFTLYRIVDEVWNMKFIYFMFCALVITAFEITFFLSLANRNKIIRNVYVSYFS